MALPISWVEYIFAAADERKAGAAKWDNDHDCGPYANLDYVCPCGCNDLRSLPVKTGDKEARSWHWDGDRTAPTFTPSIQHVPHKPGACNWHGFMTKGEWVTA